MQRAATCLPAALSIWLSLPIKQQNDGADNQDQDREVRGAVCSGVLQHVWAALWFLQQPPLHDKPKDLFIGQTLVGLFCQSGNLPQHNSEGPAEGEPESGYTGVDFILIQGFQDSCVSLLTRHQSWWWKRHPLKTLVTSSGQGANLFLLFDSNRSHRCLWSSQNLHTR